ncbi:hypothetical protein KSP40_PGU013278 [Platanthera guangdongensis]|uniref:DAGKc domain-containing protein n=1 Tax=Platanthera guangdongensis TaxID=2320717 RepID=A0ABR2LPM9_9ASPA
MWSVHNIEKRRDPRRYSHIGLCGNIACTFSNLPLRRSDVGHLLLSALTLVRLFLPWGGTDSMILLQHNQQCHAHSACHCLLEEHYRNRHSTLAATVFFSSTASNKLQNPACNKLVHESFTSGPSHAVNITREAIREGADAVIAVGGDGTLHEVVNGFFWAGKPVCELDKGSNCVTTLGLIPLGTGSDFARTYGWHIMEEDKNFNLLAKILPEYITAGDGCLPETAVVGALWDGSEVRLERSGCCWSGSMGGRTNIPLFHYVHTGLSSKIDIGFITGSGGEHHYFINVADIHLSAKAGYYSSTYKTFGNLCYVLGALRAFIGHHNLDLKIKVDEKDWKVYDKVTALCIGNGKFFGGGMKIVPNADPSSGNMEVVILQDFKWYDFVFKLYKLYNGSHLSEPNVESKSLKSIEVAVVDGKGDIYVQSDGEHLGFLPMKCSILPGVIDFFV